MPLLERDGRHVRLTPAAHRLVARADRVLAELDAAEAELAAEQGSVRGSLVDRRLSQRRGRGSSPRRCGRWPTRHPELECSVREHEPEDGIPLLRSGELDLLVSESYDDVPAGAGRRARRARCCVTEPLLLALPARRASGAGRAGADAGRRAVDQRRRRHAVRRSGRARVPGGGLHAADRPPGRRCHAHPRRWSAPGSASACVPRAGLHAVHRRALRAGAARSPAPPHQRAPAPRGGRRPGARRPAGRSYGAVARVTAALPARSRRWRSYAP